MNREFDILIAGGGMVGLTIALLLARRNARRQMHITLVDAGRQPVFSQDDDISLRVSAIAAGTAAMLDDAEVWDRIAETRACPYRDMRVWDAAGSVEGPETLRFEAAEFAVPQLGFIVENVLIQHVLLKALARRDVSINYETRLRSVKKAGNRYAVEYGDGKSAMPELLIAADGASSFVRTSAGINVKTWKYPQSAFVTHLRPEKSHRHTAWQRFLPDGPLALLPLGDGRVSTVWTTTPENAERLSAANDDELGALLSDASDHVLGALSASGPRGSFPLKSQHADRYVTEGLALVGDAAHAVHPLAGQGANLGLADASALASEIATALEAGEHPGDLPVLRRYERPRKVANKTMLHFIDGLNRLFSNEAAPLARLRGLGMALFNKAGPIREYAVQVALGMR
ncbi:MAG: UbiH/UbiF/VisC/COQ6 family ubiquinone biosynthesis hydroxylase [Woeseiaceae bacterium]|nr:UbiH/UbiF/VisC/COQ6 family ubiquinone biosynthesis hydroxylase [Woeseiaceae bacterium]